MTSSSPTAHGEQNRSRTSHPCDHRHFSLHHGLSITYLTLQSCNLLISKRMLQLAHFFKFLSIHNFNIYMSRGISQAHNSFLSTSRQSLTHEGSCFIQTCPTSPVVWWWMLNNHLSHNLYVWGFL